MINNNIKIYTSYFGALKRLDKDIVPISICAKAPDWYTGLQYKKVAPSWAIFNEWKLSKDNKKYTEHFISEILQNLNIEDVLADLHIMAEGKDIALICYEIPDAFCHRHLVANWINEKTSMEVVEF